MRDAPASEINTRQYTLGMKMFGVLYGIHIYIIGRREREMTTNDDKKWWVWGPLDFSSILFVIAMAIKLLVFGRWSFVLYMPLQRGGDIQYWIKRQNHCRDV